MKVAFVGTVESSRVALRASMNGGFPPALVVTLPPELRDRHSDYADITPLAREAEAELVLAANVNAEDVVRAVVEAEPEVTLVVGWSQICRLPLMSAARIGTVGFHPSLLPGMRGRAVIPWTILTAVAETGSTLFWIEEGLDSGDILLQRRFPVPEDATARWLYDRHLTELATLVPEALRMLAVGDRPRRPQNQSDASWCARRTADDGRIDWRASAADVLRLIRAVGNPYPGAFTEDGASRLFIDAAEPIEGPARFIGFPGQVQQVNAASFAVLCGDGNAIRVLRWRSPLDQSPRLHARFH
jgi:methionyl-tRNA formyltransferase